jgi:hypothetical protein
MLLDPLRFGQNRTIQTNEEAGIDRQPEQNPNKPPVLIGAASFNNVPDIGMSNTEIQNDDVMLPYQKL